MYIHQKLILYWKTWPALLILDKWSAYLFNITAAEVLLEEELYLLHQVLDWSGATTHTPHIIQAHHTVLHAQQIFCAA